MNWLADTIKTHGKPNFPCQYVGISDSGGIKFRMDSTYFEINDDVIVFKDAQTMVPGRTDIPNADPVHLLGTIHPSQYALAYLHCKTPFVKTAEPGTLLARELSSSSAHVKMFLCRVLEGAADAGVSHSSLIKNLQDTGTLDKLEATQDGIYAEFMAERTQASEPLKLDIDTFIETRANLAFLLGKKVKKVDYATEKYLLPPTTGFEGLVESWDRELTGSFGRSVIYASDRQSVAVTVDSSRFRAIKSNKGVVLVGAVYDCLLKQENLTRGLSWKAKNLNIARGIAVDNYLPTNRTTLAILEEERVRENKRLLALAALRTPEEATVHRSQHVSELPIF